MSRRWLFWVFLLQVSCLLADDLSLVRVGESWSYFCASNAPSSPISAWYQPGFDDSAWLRGPSGFSTSFVVDFREATVWPDAVGYRSVFLRKTFNVTDPSVIRWLALRLDYDDGFVAYLNGQEILRHGLTNSPVGFNDPAAPHPGGAAEEFNVSTSINLLQSGSNLLAIEVHAALTNEPGNINSMRLVPELLANFQRGPFVQNASTNRIQVVWRTPVPANSAVLFGSTPVLGSEMADATQTNQHVITLTNLQPNTEYFYCVRSAEGTNSAVSPTNSFHTLKSSGDVKFLVIGDAGSGSVPVHQIAAAMRQSSADLVMHVGDVVYPNFTFGLEDTRCLSIYGPQMRSVPFYFTMGNHELDGGALGNAYLATFYLPTNTVFGTKHFYSFDHGDAHFTVLFVPSFQPFPGFAAYDLREGSAQYQWLTNDLAASSKPWKFIFLHQPLATSGNHRTDVYNGSPLYDWQVAQDMLIPVARQYGVQMIFSGHDHDLETFNPVGGVQLIVNGASGGDMNGIEFARDAASSQFYTVSEFTRISVNGNSLHWEAVGTDGQTFDEFFLERTPPVPQTNTAAFHTPLVETLPANDGHGNITGQTFDFSGDPIATFPGEYSNLGRVYVNHDTTNLFVGFKHAMIYSNNNIFLFIESPHLAGVADLAGLGNGNADTGQGVDGLDFLENLSFTNFTPSIACLFGDEFADSQQRTFFRPGLSLNVGQGVFHLNSNFRSISGIRLQQFNRSPQALDPYLINFPERNANFIEVSIPFDELGGLQAGETIKIAAVVGLGGYDPNSQTRQLDTSFLGSFMSGSGQSNVVLGALTVQLGQPVLTVQANNLSRAYGTTNPPLTVSYSGFVGGDTPSVLNGAPQLSTTAQTNSPIGPYPIQVAPGTLSSSNYTFNFVDGTLTVTQAVLTATVSNQSRLYGQTNPPFSGTIAGVFNQDVITANYATTATPTSPVGQFAILPVLSGGALSNYTIVTNAGSLSITPAPLTVTADNKTRKYGGVDPVFTGTVEGILNGDPIQPFYSTPASPTSPIGAYDIVPGVSGAAIGNYAVTTNRGTLTITAAPLTVRADDQIRPYGRTNAPLTVSYLGFVNGQNSNILTGGVQLSTVADTNSPVGTYAITVSSGNLSATDTNYSLTFSNGTLTVTQAVLTVKADDQIRPYGSINPPLTFSYGGFVNGQDTNILTGGPVLTQLAETNSPIGPYPIAVSLGTLAVADTNYILTPINGTLMVTEAVLTVTANNSQRTYGATNPVLSGTLQGVQNLDALTVVYFSSATPTNPVGVYPILPVLSGPALSNYFVITNAGTLTITAAPVTVIADNQIRPYGATNPPLTASYAGLVNGETPAVLNGAPLLSTSADTNSPIGTYPIEITAGTLSHSNYLFSFTNGLLQVTQAVLNVRADDKARIYGDTNPPLTISYSGFVNGHGTNILSGNAVVSTTADTNSAAGTYPITLSPNTLIILNTNYILRFIEGTLTITTAGSSVLVNSSLNPCPNGTEVTFTAAVSALPPAVTVPGGNVRFLENGVVLGSANLTNGQTSLHFILFNAGTNEIRAEYSGDTNFQSSTNSLLQAVIAPCSSVSFVLSFAQTQTNVFTFTFLGTTNAQYFLLQTTNISLTSNWITVPNSTNTAINGLWSFSVTNSSADPSFRFFRAQAVQPCP